MGWKAVGEPVVRKQWGRWLVRVDGIDTESGRIQPRQLGTYESLRLARLAARAATCWWHWLTRVPEPSLDKRTVSTRWCPVPDAQ